MSTKHSFQVIRYTQEVHNKTQTQIQIINSPMPWGISWRVRYARLRTPNFLLCAASLSVDDARNLRQLLQKCCSNILHIARCLVLIARFVAADRTHFVVIVVVLI